MAIGTSAAVVSGVATVHDYDAFGLVVGINEQATEAAGVVSNAIGGGAKAVDALMTAIVGAGGDTCAAGLRRR